MQLLQYSRMEIGLAQVYRAARVMYGSIYNVVTAGAPVGQVEDPLVKTAAKPWTISSAILALAGMIVAGVGLYFIVLRPPLLPEDVRYMNLSAAELETIGPRLATWLTHVFTVLGGYALATGVLLIALAATAFRARHPVAVIGVLVGGASSIGLMSIVNFMIDSDFKWALLACALVWALSLVVFWFESRSLPGATFQ